MFLCVQVVCHWLQEHSHLFPVHVFPKKGKNYFVPFLLQSKFAILFREREHRKQKILDGEVTLFYFSFLVSCC